MCMYIYVCICICMYMYVYAYKYMCAYMHVSVCMCLYVCAYVCTCKYMYVYVCIRMYMNVFICLWMCYITEAGISALGVFVMLDEAGISALGGKRVKPHTLLITTLKNIVYTLTRGINLVWKLGVGGSCILKVQQIPHVAQDWGYHRGILIELYTNLSIDEKSPLCKVFSSHIIISLYIIW